jgi:succinate dehydrogenase / fumarate reductase cytochrome b subunit
MSVNRPLSPHLTIYKPQITSILSITHRITGFALFVSLLAFSWWVIANVFGCSKCINPLISSTWGSLVLIGINAVIYYHLLNGIRHLLWDTGRAYSIPAVYRTGYLVIAGTIILTAVTWYEVIAAMIGVAL